MKIGNLDISSIKVGSADCKVYLGDTKLYPTAPTFKWLATYTGGSTTSAECDSSSAITNGEITLTNLVSVEISDCVTSISDQAFFGCSSLTSVNIPNSVTSIGSNAFGICKGLTSVTIPDSVTSIRSLAFQQCSSLTSITIPDSVTSIGQSAFSNCRGLTSVTIGSGVTNISNYTFDTCTSLTSVNIPSGVTTIGDYVFRNCSSLTSITVDSNNTVYDSRNNCNAIIETNTNKLVVGCKSTVIPNTVTSIGDNAFFNCNLTSVNIPNSVTSIGSSAFNGCRRFTSVTVEATTPPTLGGGAFSNTNNYFIIYVPASSVSAYQSASGWSTYASRIQAIPT